MSKQGDVFKCESCGAVVEVLQGSGCDPVCCGDPMKLLKENSVDAAKEKHVPVISKVEGGWKVTVGSVAHPMEEKHYIQWIELCAGGEVYRKMLKPGDKPEACFATTASKVSARALCNLHGLWVA
jgi:superoxide reductase